MLALNVLHQYVKSHVLIVCD